VGPDDFGTQSFNITLNDTCTQVNYTITINVSNNPPVYDNPVPPFPIYPPLTIPLNSVQSIPVPVFHDPDGSDSKVYV
jgi:hypothetical protein